MDKIIAIANQKGGVGKTTTCINLGACLAAINKKTLIVDIDPQGNATTGSGINKHDINYSIYDVLINNCDNKNVIITTEHAKYDVIPANRDLTAAEVELLKLPNKESRLKNYLNQITNKYDYILIDCPPALSMLTINALVAANDIIIPMQCEYYALEGLVDLQNSINTIKQYLNPKLHITGLIRTMFDPRASLTIDVSNQLKEHFKDLLFDTTIPRNVRLAEAPSFGMPALIYDKQSRGSLAYFALASELVRRNRKLKGN